MFKIAAVLLLLMLSFSSALPQNRLRMRGNRAGDVRFRGMERQAAREEQNGLGVEPVPQNGARGRAAEEEQREEQNQGALPEAEMEQNRDEGEQSVGGEQNEQPEQGEEQNMQIEQTEDQAIQREEQNEQRDQSSEKKQSIPNYEFTYGVHDPVTGDHKDQWEKRVGDHVQGFYSLDQPDGKTRLVEYEADSKRGFEALVTEIKRDEDTKEGHSKKESNDKMNEIAHSYTKVKIIH